MMTARSKLCQQQKEALLRDGCKLPVELPGFKVTVKWTKEDAAYLFCHGVQPEF